METWLWLIVGVLVTLLVGVVVGRWLLQRFARPPKDLVERFGQLTWRQRLDLGVGLIRDERLPLGIRLLIPAVGLYLIMPFDIIPDFIPVIGALDDVLIVLIALRLLLRAIPRQVLDDHFARLGQVDGQLQLDDGTIEVYGTTLDRPTSP